MTTFKNYITGATAVIMIGGAMVATPASAGGSGMYHWHEDGWHWHGGGGGWNCGSTWGGCNHGPNEGALIGAGVAGMALGAIAVGAAEQALQQRYYDAGEICQRPVYDSMGDVRGYQRVPCR